MKYFVSLLLVGLMATQASASGLFGGGLFSRQRVCNNHVQQVQVVTVVPTQTVVQAVRTIQFVEVPHQQVVVQRVVVANNNHHNNVVQVRVQQVRHRGH